MNPGLITPFILSFCGTFFSIPFFRLLAYKFSILDIPDGILKQHDRATPYLGGAAIYCGFMVSFFLFATWSWQSTSLFLGLTILLGVGLIDDVFAIKPSQKFLGQAIAVIVFLVGGFGFEQNYVLEVIPALQSLPIISFFILKILSLWWMLSIINAFNLVDIMDGLATTIAILALVFFTALSFVWGVPEQATFLIAFLASLMAFFFYNRPKASMYMGDTGSLVVGGFLALTPFMIGWGNKNSLINLALPMVILMVPVMELFFLIIIRASKKLPVYYGSPHHFICYLKKKGWGVAHILLITAFVCCAFGAYSLSVAIGIFSKAAFLAFVAITLITWSCTIYF